MINAPNKNLNITLSSDGKRYAKWNLGKYVAPTLTVSGWGQTANGGIEPSGPITGPVPLAIFCHAIGTESSNATLDVFREDGYRFDFGYGNVYSAGTWQYSGKPKGEQIGGPVAAHVYETPGTYILSLRTQDPTGNSFDLKTKIIVVDANNYWTSEGRTTVLLANASTSVWPTWANNTRYLLESGKNYTRLGYISISDRQNVCIQSYGVDGKINSHSLVSGGSGYTSGTYTYVPIWGGVGWGASANITVTSGSVTSVTIANTGSGYIVGDKLTVYDGTGGEIGSSGSGFLINVTSTINETDIKPIVDGCAVDSTASTGGPKSTQRIVINSLDANSKTTITDAYYNDTGRLLSTGSASDVLFYNTDCRSFIGGTLTLFNWDGSSKTIPYPRPRRNFFYQCTANAQRGTIANTHLPFFDQMYELAIMGCYSTFAGEHALRVQGAQFGFIAHNKLFRPGTAKHSLTIRGGGLQNLSAVIYDSNTRIPATRYILAADNVLGANDDTSFEDITWVAYIGPQSNATVESLENIILERNSYANIAGYVLPYTSSRGCRKITVRDEIYSSNNPDNDGLSSSLDYGNTATGIGNVNAPGYATQNVSPYPIWFNGPWYSNKFVSGATVDGIYKISTPTGIISPRPIANVEVYLTARGWGQEVQAGGSIVGPAPLVVYFDAVDTRSANASYNTFRDFGYHFDFGYDSANAAIIGNWQYSNRPKANQIGGPIAAHMYEIPGTYTASVRAQNPQGEYQDKFVTIVVQDANVVYSGTKTILVSNTGATDAAYPSAATYNIAASGVVSFQSDRRYLFKAGENYSSYGVNGLTSNVFRFQISSFGTGDKPVINLGTNGIGYNPTDKKLTAGVIQNANVRDMRLTYANDVHYNNCERYTSGFSGCADPSLIAANKSDANNEFPINCGIWNSTYYADRTTPGAGGQCFYGVGKYISYVGNDPYNGSHTIRSAQTHRGFFAHNRLNSPANDTLSHIKLHSGSQGNFAQAYPSQAYDTPIKGILPFSVNANTVADFPTYGFENRYVVIADNVIPPANNNWQIAVKPQNANADERVRDVIIERIVYQNNPGATNSSQRAAVLGGQNIVVRDCTVGTRLPTVHYGIDSPSDVGNYLPVPFRGPYYIPSPHPDIGAANNTFASVTGIIPNKAGT